MDNIGQLLLVSLLQKAKIRTENNLFSKAREDDPILFKLCVSAKCYVKCEHGQYRPTPLRTFTSKGYNSSKCEIRARLFLNLANLNIYTNRISCMKKG